MEEESGVKAPVTRLRRRLSVEAEDVSSPQAPSTPKKRSTRLAAKPLLDNIDENAPIASPKPTRGIKSIARDLAEPEEKVVTPSRRSVRIKSNTSLTSETSVALDSPRAKRAARRNSNIGSDTEAPQTPVLQTRKTRKNSDGVEQLEMPQLQSKPTEIQKTTPKVEKKKELQNTPPNFPAEVVSKLAKQLTNESVIFAEEPQIQKPQSKKISKELHKTPEKVQDKPELQKTPQNVPEKTELQKTPLNEELQNSTTTVENKAEVVKEPPAAKINSKELLKTPQKDAEKIALQKTPHNATEKIELNNPPTVENEVEVVTNKVKQFAQAELQKRRNLIQAPLKVPEIAKLQNPLTMPEKSRLQNSTLNSFGFAQVATETTVRLPKETSIYAIKPDLQIPQKKRKSKELHRVPLKKPVDTEIEKAPQIGPENAVIAVNPQMLLSPYFPNSEESRQANDIYQQPLRKILETKDLTIFIHDNLKNMPPNPTQRPHCNEPKKNNKCPNIKVAPENPKLPNASIFDCNKKRCPIIKVAPENQNASKLDLNKKIIAMLPDNHDNLKKMPPNPTQRPHCNVPKKNNKYPNIKVATENQKLPNASKFYCNKKRCPNIKLAPENQNASKLDLNKKIIAMVPDNHDNSEKCKGVPKSTKKSQVCKSQVKIGDFVPINDIMNYCNWMVNALNFESAENSTGIPPFHYSVPNSLNEAHLPNSRCKNSRQAGKSNNLSLDISISNSSIAAIPLNSQTQSSRKSGANSIDMLSLDYSLHNSSNVAVLPNSRCKSSRKAETSNLSLDISLPSSSIGAIPLDSQHQSSRKSAVSSIENLPLDYSLPKFSNEAVLSTSQYKSSSKAEKSDNLFLDISLPNSSIKAFPLDSQLQNSRKSAETSIDTLPPQHQLPYSSNEALLPNKRCKSSRNAEISNLSLEISLPCSSIGAIPPDSQRQSPRKSAEYSIDTLPPDDSLPRMRLDSSHELSAVKSDANNCNNSVVNEHKMTAVVDKSIITTTDPPKTAIKVEPMIPQKDSYISIVNITVRQDVEEVQVAEDASMMHANETSDPLQATMALNDCEESSSSGKEKIIQNYDSMIMELINKNYKNKVKHHDIPLIINKKSKVKANNFIVDQLNLSLPNYSNKAPRPNKRCKSSRKAEISNLSLDISLPSFSIGAIPPDSQRQSPRKTAEYPIDILPPDNSLPKSSIEAVLSNSKCKSSRKAEKTKTNLPLDKILPNSSNEDILIDSRCQSSRKSAEHSIDFLPPDYLLPNSSNEAFLSNTQCKSSGKTEKSNDLSLDKSLPNSSNEAIPLHSRCQSPRKSAENSIDILPPDYSLPNYSNEAVLLNSQCKSSRKAEKFNNLSFDKSLPNSSTGAIPLNSQGPNLRNSAENSIDILPPDNSLPRMRLDSSHELSAVKSDANMSVYRKTNESKQILDNNCNNSVVNEHEITAVADKSIIAKTDPLKTAIKAEPMTPQKDFDVSTVNISARQDVKEVQVVEDASMMHANETSDPLQATMALYDCEESLSSNNEEIIQDYDPMIMELIKKNYKNKVKDHDISLNMNNKSKVKANNPILDQLNLNLPNSSNEALLSNTQCKSSRKAEKSNNTSLDKLLPNSSIGTIPLNSPHKSASESVENSIDILPPAFSLPNSSNEALLPNSQCKSFRKAEKSNDISLDKSLPNSLIGAIPHNSDGHSPRKSVENSIDVLPPDNSLLNSSNEALRPNNRRRSSRLAEKSKNNLSLDNSLTSSLNRAIKFNSRRQSPKSGKKESVIGTPKKLLPQEHPVTQPIIIFPKNWCKTKPITKPPDIYFPKNWGKTLPITKQPGNTLKMHFSDTTNSSADILKKQMTKLEKNVRDSSNRNQIMEKKCETGTLFDVNDIEDSVSTVTDFTFATDSEHSIIVYIDEDQANVDKLLQLSQETTNKAESGDQCVPVMNRLDLPAGIVNDLTPVNCPLSKPKEKTESVSSQKGVEPMDIDESLPCNISITDYSKENLSEVNNQAEFDEPNKSKLSKSSSNMSEKACNENKSTLILSRVNNESITETNLGKSPIIPSKETLENLSNVSDIGKNRAFKKTSMSNITENNDTPLKHINSNILGMQTSTPVTSTKHEIIVEKCLKNTSKNTPSKNISVASRKSNTSNSYSSDESSEEENMSKLVIDEAEDAGEDYESGDSRDESEKQYELENEIPEKDETLDTDSSEEDSDDEDYENDSFIVSSDQEDDDLLSGTGDDLSMSDKELTMAAKSKKKFNDRKLKEQKKASKEMYAARHNKKPSLHDSSDDDTREVKPKKKKNRMRLDSSHELSAINSDANMSVSRKTNESKQILENNCNNSVVNEHEITAVVDQSIITKTDPLKTAIKAEPMTPQKDFDISTVNITVRQDVEEVQVAEDASMLHANETSDPLQATMALNDGEESSSSGNEEIIQNYDSMLMELRKNNYKNKVKDHDISQNINKKSKMKANNPIVDQLNLTNAKEHKIRKTDESQDKNKSSNKMEVDSTDDSLSNSSDLMAKVNNKNKLIKTHDTSLNQTKKSKSREEDPIVDQLNLTNTKERKRRTTDQNQIKSNKTSNQTEADVTDDTSSDSLDLKLLFPDDDSDTSEDKINKSRQSNTEDFIPLKRAKGKTDLHESKENQGNISPIKTSEGNKKKNKKLSVTQNNADQSGEVASVYQVGAPSPKKKNEKILESEQTGNAAISLANLSATEPSSLKKKNKKRLSDLQNVNQIDGATATENKSSSKMKNKKDTSCTVIDSTETEMTENEQNVSKKNKIKKFEESFIVTDSTDNKPDVSIGSSKKNKRKEYLTAIETTTEVTENEANNTVSSSKQNNRKATESFTVTDMIENNMNLSVGKNKEKKKKSSESFTATDITEMGTTENLANISVTCNKKKHRKASESLPVADATEIDEPLQNKSLPETPGSTKKKKKLSESQSLDEPASKELTEKTENAINTSLVSDKKKNRKVSESLTALDSTDKASEKPLNTSLPLENAKRKKNKNKNLSTSLPTSQLNSENTIENITNSSKKKIHKHSETSEASNEDVLKDDEAPKEASSKKRKRKSSILGGTEDGAQESSKLHNDSLLAAGSHKKKVKLSTEVENEFKLVMSPNKAMDGGVVENNKKKKKKSKLNDKAVAQENESAAASQPQSVEETSQVSFKEKQKTQTETTEKDRPKNIPDKKNKKRKEREDDEGFKQTKVLKENFFDNIQISRLPNAFLEQLENPKTKQPKIKKIVSTSAFIVEETVKRRNKPSQYLEESIYLNSDSPEKRRNNTMKKPKVLPFVPTASTSGRGFTTNFQVKVCPQEVKFIAQSSDTVNFKKDYIQRQKLKKLGTYEMYKNQRKVKLSKF